MDTSIKAGSESWLSLGSNLGDRAAMIEAALAALAETPGIRVTARSRLHETPPWGDTDQGPFLNAACAIETDLAPLALLDACQAIELRLGRVRTLRWGPRSIDIDIIHVVGVTMTNPRLTLPHPLWRERAFVLAPLAEVAPGLVVGGVAVADALAAIDLPEPL